MTLRAAKRRAFSNASSIARKAISSSPLRRFLAIASDERDRISGLQQIHRGPDLPLGQPEFGGNELGRGFQIQIVGSLR